MKGIRQRCRTACSVSVAALGSRSPDFSLSDKLPAPSLVTYSPGCFIVIVDVESKERGDTNLDDALEHLG